MDDSNNENWREFVPEKLRIKNVESIKKTLQKAQEIKSRRSNSSKWPSESLVMEAVKFEAGAFFRAANQQDYTEAITISNMWLELKYGLVTPASEFAESSNSQMIPDPVELPGHQRSQENQENKEKQENKENQENQDPDDESIRTKSDHLNGRTLHSSAGVQISGASTPRALGFEPAEDHLRIPALKEALEKDNAHMGVPDTDDKIVPAISIQMPGAVDSQVDPDVSSRSIRSSRRIARARRKIHKN